MPLQMPEAAKRLRGVLKEFFILILHFQADFDKIMEEDWLAEQPVPGHGVSSLERSSYSCSPRMQHGSTFETLHPKIKRG